MITFSINWLALITGVVATMVLGILWYSPLLFGKPWMKAMNIDPKDKKKMDEMKKGMMPSMVGQLIATLIMGFILINLTQGLVEIMDGLQFVFWLWLGFVAATGFTNVLYEDKPFVVFLIGTTYHLASLLTMSAIFISWPL